MSVRENMNATTEAIKYAQQKSLKGAGQVMAIQKEYGREIERALKAGDELAKRDERKRLADRKSLEFQQRRQLEDKELGMAAAIAERNLRTRSIKRLSTRASSESEAVSVKRRVLHMRAALEDKAGQVLRDAHNTQLDEERFRPIDANCTNNSPGTAKKLNPSKQ